MLQSFVDTSRNYRQMGIWPQMKKLLRYSPNAAYNPFNITIHVKITKELFPRWKIYLALSSPAIVSCIWAIGMISDKRWKDATEAYFPSFGA